MDILGVLQSILAVSVVLGVLVFIHEGGHFLAARAFGVRVTEFMIGFPGPGVSVKRGETSFGVTCVPLGGYARICGMEPGEESPHLEAALTSMYRRGTAYMEDVAADCGITSDEAFAALDELVEWGCITAPKKEDQYNTFRVVESPKLSRRARRKLAAAGLPEPSRFQEGDARPVEDPHDLFEHERKQQYRSQPFWKRCVIVLAGIGVNLIFAMVVFVILYSVLGFDVQSTETGEIRHIVVDPLTAIMAGFNYIGMVVVAVAGLFNPATAAQTVSDSTSVIGIAVISKSAFEQGLTSVLSLTAMLSVSLGIMNLLPIPPLDGGRFVVEVYQKIRRKNVSARAMNTLSIAGMALFLAFFAVMLNQDVQRFIFGNW